MSHSHYLHFAGEGELELTDGSFTKVDTDFLIQVADCTGGGFIRSRDPKLRELKKKLIEGTLHLKEQELSGSGTEVAPLAVTAFFTAEGDMPCVVHGLLGVTVERIPAY